jgi:hypothetical protein
MLLFKISVLILTALFIFVIYLISQQEYFYEVSPVTIFEFKTKYFPVNNSTFRCTPYVKVKYTYDGENHYINYYVHGKYQIFTSNNNSDFQCIMELLRWKKYNISDVMTNRILRIPTDDPDCAWCCCGGDCDCDDLSYMTMPEKSHDIFYFYINIFCIITTYLRVHDSRLT